MSEQDQTVDTIEKELLTESLPEEQEERTPRGSESREATQRYESWDNPSNLPDPTPQPGWVFRYIRTSVIGETDVTNVSKRFREGWKPCKLEDHPELQLHMMDHKSDWAKKGHVEIGGLLLCKMPEERAKARDEYFSKMAQQQMASVDNVYFKNQDSRMATKQVFERKSRTSFGRDS